VGVPYSDEMVENAEADLMDQANPDADWSGLEERYPKAVLGDFDGDPTKVTEMDALVAYLQMLGTLVDFSVYEPEENYR
jgi:cytochrome c oxidase cbb3-type subunit 2